MADRAAFERAAALIGQSARIVMVTHRKPDGDALGSLLALTILLRQQGRQVTPVCLDEVPRHYRFIPEIDQVVAEFDPGDADLVVVLDCGQDRLSGVDLTTLPAGCRLLEIDHHSKQGALVPPRELLHDTTAAATTELIFRLARVAQWPIPRPAATALLTGIITDTSAFQNSNTTAATMQAAAELLRAGAKLKEIIKNCFYSSSIPKLRLWGTALSRIQPQAQAHGLVTTVLTAEDFAEAGAHPEDSEGLVNFLNAIPGVPAIMLLTDLGDGAIKGSLRTRQPQIDVAQVAGLFGGGGHSQAAGFSVPGSLRRDQSEQWQVVEPN